MIEFVIESRAKGGILMQLGIATVTQNPIDQYCSQPPLKSGQPEIKPTPSTKLLRTTSESSIKFDVLMSGTSLTFI